MSHQPRLQQRADEGTTAVHAYGRGTFALAEPRECGGKIDALGADDRQLRRIPHPLRPYL